jgi:NAD(P)-dependent dehydrogenase (short-subunit alcohol dehydrogenase family)
MSGREQIAALAARHAIALIVDQRNLPAASLLMSYGNDRLETNRQAGMNIDRILKGEKAGDLPVQQSTKFQFTPVSAGANWNDFSGCGVLITGGTKGIGLATGLAFGKRGADVTLTYKWGSADMEAIRAAFAAVGAREPDIVDADVAREDDVRAVIARIRERHESLYAFISNVAFAPSVQSVEDYSRRGLATATDYSVWPIVSHTRAVKDIFGSYPRYVVAMSSEGADFYHVNYDIVAATKAMLEALCKYMNQRLREQGSRVNVLRTRFTRTESMRAVVGDEFESFLDKHSPGLFTDVSEVAEAAVGLCSGLMDAIGGQIITVDHGANLFDNLGRLYAERDSGTLALQKPAP